MNRKRIVISSIAISTLCVFAVNVAHCLRPISCADCFWPYGIPFTYFHQGGFVGGAGWVWAGLVGDIAIALAAGLILSLIRITRNTNAVANPRLDASISTAGITLFTAFVLMEVALFNVPGVEAAYRLHELTGWVYLAVSVQSLSGRLLLVWMIVALAYALIRWTKSSTRFRLYLLMNGFVVAVMLAQMYSELR